MEKRNVTEIESKQLLKNMINGFRLSQAIYVAATLGIADHLQNGAQSSDSLASSTGAHPLALYRLLRTLAAVGIFHESDARAFSLTAIGESLCSDVTGSLRSWAQYAAAPPAWAAWNNLLHSVRTGENAFQRAHGMGVWEFRAVNPTEGAIFDAAMRDSTARLAEAVLSGCNIGRFSKIIDVGGGDGELVATLVAAHPRLEGIVIDQPHVVVGANDVFVRKGVADRCKAIAGNFFDPLPFSGDAYVLKFILHNWEDEPAVSILRACRRSMDSSGRVFVIERTLSNPNEGDETKLSDLNMLVSAGGQERTLSQFNELFSSAKLQLVKVTKVFGELNIIEASVT